MSEKPQVGHLQKNCGYCIIAGKNPLQVHKFAGKQPQHPLKFFAKKEVRKGQARALPLSESSLAFASFIWSATAW